MRDDITLLVHERLESNSRLRRYQASLKAEILSTLTREAHGMFRWVQCQLDTLSRLRTAGAVREALNKLPQTLDRTYENLLCRIDDEEDKVIARDVLEILVFAVRPLRLPELCDMLQVTPGLRELDESKCLVDPMEIFSICGSLISYRKETGIVSLAHHSVKTYLLTGLQGTDSFSRLKAAEAHKNFAIKCLTYLSFDAFSGEPHSTKETLDFAQQNPLRRRFPLLDYAAQRWALHLGYLKELDESTWQILKDFLFSADRGRGNFYAWVQLLIPNSKATQIKNTPPLYYAASFGLTEVVRYLLDAGADIEVHGGRGGATPLNIASYRGHYDVAKLLLERGASPSAIDNYVEWSAIDWARYNGHVKVYRLLTGTEDGTEDDPHFDLEAARADLKLRRWEMGDIGAQKQTVAKRVIESPWNRTSADRHLWWSLVVLAESQSKHPAGKAILQFASQWLHRHDDASFNASIQHFEAIPGRGVSVYIEHGSANPPRTYHVLVGTRHLLHARTVQSPEDVKTFPVPKSPFPSEDHFSWVLVAIDREYAGALALTESIIATNQSTNGRWASGEPVTQPGDTGNNDEETPELELRPHRFGEPSASPDSEGKMLPGS